MQEDSRQPITGGQMRIIRFGGARMDWPICGLTFAALMTFVFRLPVSPLREWPAPSYRKQVNLLGPALDRMTHPNEVVNPLNGMEWLGIFVLSPLCHTE